MSFPSRGDSPGPRHRLGWVPACPSCTRENPEGFEYCGFCASPLTDARPTPTEERKIVTVLFCDLVGFTAASDNADPEDVRARIRPYHARLRHEIETYGGTVEKFIGDAVMAVFGAPVAHEDDPERAVKAGLRILEAITDLNETDAGLDLQVRVGIETGEAVVSLDARLEEGEGMVTGDVVNTASRLQGAAPVGGVGVGEGTYAATKAVFDYDPLEPVTLKGKADPVPIFHAKAALSRFGTDITRSLSTPLVGRELERDLLTGTFERSVRDASVQLVTIVGEPGVGKSRLVAEMLGFVQEWPDLIRWRQGRCLPYGEGVTFWALGEIVKAEAGILETDSTDVAASKVEALISDAHPDAPWLRQRLRPLVGLEAPSAGREENFAAWRVFLEALAEARPSVFVFEDLHWADDALLAFLEHLADYAEGVPMFVLGTTRPELFERAPGFAQAARNSNRIGLFPLTEPEMARLIANLLESAVLPAEVQDAIVVRAGGNPLYAEEFVRLLKDTGILARHGRTWTIDPQAEIPLPSGVQGLIAARLDTVAPERKGLLQDAAVVGKVFWAETVTAMGERNPKEVAAALHELSRKELIRPVRASSMEGQAEFSFLHALIRDVCYAQIPRASRADRHRRAATWIEAVSGERVEDHAEILAVHYSTALELASAGRDAATEDLQDKALRYLTLAGDRALGIDVEAAERHFARALTMAPQGHPERPEILLRHGDSLSQRGRHAEADGAFEQAIEGYRARGDVRAMAVAMSRHGLVLWRMGDPRNRAVSAEAITTLEPLGPSPELVQVLTEMSGDTMMATEFAQAMAYADRAIAMSADLGLPEPARAHGFRGATRIALGDVGGVEEMRRATDVANAQGLGREVALQQLNLAEAIAPIEGPRTSLEAMRKGIGFAQRRGIEEFVTAFGGGAVAALAELGSYEEALATAEELVPRLEAGGDVWLLVWMRSVQARILVRRGEHAAAEPLAAWLAERGRAMAQTQTLAHVLLAAAAVRSSLGDAAAVVTLLAELASVPNIAADLQYAWGLADAVRMALAAGDLELALRLQEGVEPVHPLREHVLVTTGALLAEHRGEHASAADRFADADERWKAFESPWERAHALFGRGRCLLVLGQAAEAAGALREAREVFASLGARPSVAQVDAVLATVTARTS